MWCIYFADDQEISKAIKIKIVVGKPFCQTWVSLLYIYTCDPSSNSSNIIRINIFVPVIVENGLYVGTDKTFTA